MRPPFGSGDCRHSRDSAFVACQIESAEKGPCIGLARGRVYVSCQAFMSLVTGSFPEYRPRRLRGSAALRALVRETELNARQLVLPLFARGGKKVRQAIGSMPGCFQLSVD